MVWSHCLIDHSVKILLQYISTCQLVYIMHQISIQSCALYQNALLIYQSQGFLQLALPPLVFVHQHYRASKTTYLILHMILYQPIFSALLKISRNNLCILYVCNTIHIGTKVIPHTIHDHPIPCLYLYYWDCFDVQFTCSLQSTVICIHFRLQRRGVRGGKD